MSVELVTTNAQTNIVEFGTNNTIREMEARLAEIEAKMKLAQDFFKRVMTKDVHYGVIPGAKKPALYQPGADLLNSLYGFSMVIVNKDENKDYATGHYEVSVRVRLVHKGTQINVGEGEGFATTREAKYRYRWVTERDLPKGIDKATLPTKTVEIKSENKPGTFTLTLYRIENDDLFSLWNTVLKMAIKRAYVRATLAATGLSGLFSQEEEELEAWIEGEEEQGNSEQSEQSAPQKQKNGNKPEKAEVATDKQVKAIFARGRNKGLSAEQIKNLVYQQTGKDVDKLTVQEASNLIDLFDRKSNNELAAMAVPANEAHVPADEDAPPSLFGGGHS